MIAKPNTNEYPVYYDKYIQLVDADVIHFLKKQEERILELAKNIDENLSLHKYAENKWSIRELFCHCVDTERIMAYRALSIARNDQTPLPGYDENEYIKFSEADKRSFKSLIEEFELLRKSNIVLFQSFSNEASQRIGNANGNNMTARAMAYIVAGHTEHHLNILKERYL